tara:strand:+ start:5445 stop:6107 length:663 start_codon:yes stop_codon:yes gene_type:complete
MVKNSIAILCRGNSLKHIEKIPKVEEYIIVNRFADELQQQNISDTLQNQDITQILSLVPDEPTLMIQRGQYKKFKINRLVLPYIRETVPGSAQSIEGHDGQIIPSYVLGDVHKEYMYKRGTRPDGNTRYAYSYPTSGIAGVVHGTIDYGKENIFIIGLDFYQSEYAYGKAKGDLISRGEDPKMMRDFLTNFLSTQKDKKFTIVTSTDYECEYDNVKIIKV